MKQLTSEAKIIIGVIIVTGLLLVGALFVFSKQESTSQNVPVISREELLPADTYTKGNASASAYLVEFGDFQCPSCKSFAPVIEQLLQQYGDKLVFGYRHYPLQQHEYAEKSAIAVEAAGKQGKYWEYYLKLFEYQDSLSDQKITDIAKEIGLDEETFKQDQGSKEIKDKINKDKAAGNVFGVNGTPTFFLNGKRLQLRSTQDIITSIEEAIQ